MNITLDDLDSLNVRKIHTLMTSDEANIKLLQHLRLLPTLPQTIEQCGEHANHDWYTAKLSRLTDGKTLADTDVIYSVRLCHAISLILCSVNLVGCSLIHSFFFPVLYCV